MLKTSDLPDTSVTQDSSSVITFKSVRRLLDSILVHWFLLENVDMTDDETPDSNLSLILQSLEAAGTHGFHVQALLLVSSDFGVPQRRVRLYFVGVNKGKHPHFQIKAIANILDALKLKSQLPVAG